MLINLIVLIISQFVTNNHTLHPKLMYVICQQYLNKAGEINPPIQQYYLINRPQANFLPVVLLMIFQKKKKLFHAPIWNHMALLLSCHIPLFFSFTLKTSYYFSFMTLTVLKTRDNYFCRLSFNLGLSRFAS